MERGGSAVDRRAKADLGAVTEPRDPRRVRFWGWVAFAVALAIAITFVLLQQPWIKQS